MRIISGKHKGRLIQPPAGLPVRPTLDRAKEGLFNILQHRFTLAGANVLELFAGTGNMTYEFLSRSAASVVAVDEHQGCVQFMQKMFVTLHEENAKAIRMDAFKYLEQTRDTFDIIFMDPPYALGLQDKLLQLCLDRKILREEGVMVLEHMTAVNWDHHPHWLETRTYGGSSFSFFIWNPPTDEEE
jgi:16S rRNA (guanine(966)-N(2))-methyltransferase RsmD